MQIAKKILRMYQMSAAVFWDKHWQGDHIGLSPTIYHARKTQRYDDTKKNFPIGTVLVDMNLSRGDSGLYWVRDYGDISGNLIVKEIETVDSKPFRSPDGASMVITRSPSQPLKSKNYWSGRIALTIRGGSWQFEERTSSGLPARFEVWQGQPLVIHLPNRPSP